MFRRRFLISLTSIIALRTLAAPPPREHTRIERLISFVEAQKDMTFIRNGTEYSCTDAAKFLRGKWQAMGDEVMTAREFIERIGTKSSMSGEPYRVKFADGKVMAAAQFLSDELRRIEAHPA